MSEVDDIRYEVMDAISNARSRLEILKSECDDLENTLDNLEGEL